MDDDEKKWKLAIERRLREGHTRMDLIQRELSANTQVTTEIKDILNVARTGLSVLGGLGAVAKWVGALAGAALALWSFFYALTHGGPPNK